MEAKDIDSEGNWTYLGETTALLGATIPVPNNVRQQGGGDEEQEVFMLIQAKDYFHSCPECDAGLPENTIILLTSNAKMMPVKCCNSIIWMTDRRGNNGRRDYT